MEWALRQVEVATQEEIDAFTGRVLPIAADPQVLAETGAKLGDHVRIRCVGGYVEEVSARTLKTTGRPQLFRVRAPY